MRTTQRQLCRLRIAGASRHWAEGIRRVHPPIHDLGMQRHPNGGGRTNASGQQWRRGTRDPLGACWQTAPRADRAVPAEPDTLPRNLLRRASGPQGRPGPGPQQDSPTQLSTIPGAGLLWMISRSAVGCNSVSLCDQPIPPRAVCQPMAVPLRDALASPDPASPTVKRQQPGVVGATRGDRVR